MVRAAASKDKKMKSGLYIPPHLKKKQEALEAQKTLFCSEESPEAALSAQKKKPIPSEKKISVAEEVKRQKDKSQPRQKSPFQSYRERQNEVLKDHASLIRLALERNV